MGRIVDTNNMVVKKHGKVGKLYLPASMIGKTVRVVAVGETIEPITAEPIEPTHKNEKAPSMSNSKELIKKRYKDKQTGLCSHLQTYPSEFMCSNCNKTDCEDKPQ